MTVMHEYTVTYREETVVTATVYAHSPEDAMAQVVDHDYREVGPLGPNTSVVDWTTPDVLSVELTEEGAIPE